MNQDEVSLTETVVNQEKSKKRKIKTLTEHSEENETPSPKSNKNTKLKHVSYLKLWSELSKK